MNNEQSDPSGEIQELRQQLAESKRQLLENERLLADIQNSRSWKLMRRLRLVLFPSGSRRERTAYALLHGRLILRQEGLKALLHHTGGSIIWRIKVKLAGMRLRFKRHELIRELHLAQVDRRSDAQPHEESVDIVICVHNALEDVQNCLDSLLSGTSAPYSLILVDDGSAEETRTYLVDFQRLHPCTLLRNEQALGYTLAANQGLRKSSAEFVILLNSDTIVTPQWLERMLACARSDKHTGLVGPLSNTASWQSIPEIEANGDWAENPLPPGVSINEIGAWVAKYSARLYPSMPLLNGFCLMIRRAVIEQIGYFDEENFGKGYGEENDYCLRARQAGWQLALADDTYIYHAQSRSYSHDRRKLLSGLAGETLARKHGQRLIDEGVTYCRKGRVLEGVRARSQYYAARENYLEKGHNSFSGKRLLFILPVSTASGGANIVLSEGTAMQNMGIQAEIFNLTSHRAEFEVAYPALSLPIHYGEAGDIPALAAGFDAAIATFHPSVAWLSPAKSLKFNLILAYYIQDFEPMFYQPGSLGYQQAMQSYTLVPDFVRFTKTDWTSQEVSHHTGMTCDVVGPSFDTDLFIPRPRIETSWPERAIRIGAMIRPDTPYRAPRLTMELLQQASSSYGAMIEIWLFGVAPDDPAFLELPHDFAWRSAGKLSPPQVARFLNEIDMFVDFSSYQAMGLTALEAMGCGAAVIVPQRGGAVSFAHHQENCLVVDTSNRQACYNTLRRLVEDHNLRLRLQANALRTVPQYFPELPAYNILRALFENT